LIFGVPRSTFDKTFPDVDPDDMDLDELGEYVGYQIFRGEDGEINFDVMMAMVSGCDVQLANQGLAGGKFYYGEAYC
jgi:hypothetical protein